MKKIRKISVLIILGIFIASGITMLPSAAAITVTIEDLGTLGGIRSFAYGMNDDGLIVGESDTASGDTRGFLWSETTGMMDLGTLGGAHSLAWDINSLGQVVGDSRSGTSPEYHAFVITPEDTNSDGVPDLWNRDDNNDGANDLMMDIGTLSSSCVSPFSWAYAINDIGQVVGESRASSGYPHGYLYTPGGTDGVQSNPEMKDLGTLGGDRSLAYDINDLGQVVGQGETESGDKHAFLWTESDGMIQLEIPSTTDKSSVAWGINNLGEIVGTSDIGTPYDYAFLWTQSDGMIELGTLGGPWSDAFSINDWGQIVGRSPPVIKTYATATFWEEGEITDLGAYSDEHGGGIMMKPPTKSFAHDINFNGQAAGASFAGPDTGYHAVRYLIEEPAQSARERIDRVKRKIQAKVDAGEMSQGHANSMNKKLDAAAKKLPQQASSGQSLELTALADQMSEKDLKATINVLQALKNEINAFMRAGIFTQVEGQDLIDDVNLIISDLGG